MANATWLADEFRRAGLRVWEDSRWKTRGHATLRPIIGVICHHTAGGGLNDWRTVRDGRPGLPGPLSQMTLERDGLIRVLASGVAWHAGSGGHPNLPGGSNYNLLGIEGVSSGRWGDWTLEQMRVYPQMVAVILRHLHLPVSRCVAHKEWAPSRKIDPSFDMGVFRNNVARYLTPPRQPGGIESMAFNDTYTDWAGNKMSVKVWMDLQDKRSWEATHRHNHIVRRIDETANGIINYWKQEDERWDTLNAQLKVLEAKLDVLEQQHAADADPKA